MHFAIMQTVNQPFDEALPECFPLDTLSAVKAGHIGIEPGQARTKREQKTEWRLRGALGRYPDALLTNIDLPLQTLQ
jgi:hypothetical protein